MVTRGDWQDDPRLPETDIFYVPRRTPGEVTGEMGAERTGVWR